MKFYALSIDVPLAQYNDAYCSINGRHEAYTGFRERHATRQLIINEESRLTEL